MTRSARSSTKRPTGERPAAPRGVARSSSAVGIAVAAYLTYVHYQPAALICTGGGGCEAVQDSKYAVLAGIPIAVLGLAAWIAASRADGLELGARAHADGGARPRRRSRFAAYLVILQLFVIDAICVWCMANDVVLVPVLAVLALLRLRAASSSAHA